MNYKNHHIEVSVRAVDDPKGWRPSIFVSYTEHGKRVLKIPRMNQTFATPNEAEKGEVEDARKWIDDGKPASKVEEGVRSYASVDGVS